MGSAIGLAAGRHMGDDIKEILMQALGLSVILIGLKMALSGEKLILTVGCILVGGMTGQIIGIEKQMERLGDWLKKVCRSNSASFVEGFVSASLLYLVGAMMIVGSIQDGILNDPNTLYIKSILDGVASIALASSLGVGVAFSALSVLVVQGGLTLTAAHVTFLQDTDILNAVTATGGLLILGIGITLLGIKKCNTGNLLPAILFAIIGAKMI